MYNISEARLHENELHTQAHNTAELRMANYKTAVANFNQLQRNLTSKDTTSDEKDTAEGATNIQRVVQTGEAVGRYAGGVAKGTPWASTGMSLGSSHGLGMSALREMKIVKDAPAGITGDLTGVESVAQKGLRLAGAGDKVAFAGAKVAGNIGAVLDIGKGIDNLIQSGNVFKDADTGKMESKTDIAGDLLTVAGGALDVAAAFTGGLLAPVAAAVNLAGAATSTAGSVEDELKAKSDLKAQTPSKPTAVSSPEYETLGFVANMAQDPTKSISAR